mgnify:CR=1 FL=1
MTGSGNRRASPPPGFFVQEPLQQRHAVGAEVTGLRGQRGHGAHEELAEAFALLAPCQQLHALRRVQHGNLDGISPRLVVLVVTVLVALAILVFTLYKNIHPTDTPIGEPIAAVVWILLAAVPVLVMPAAARKLGKAIREHDGVQLISSAH